MNHRFEYKSRGGRGGSRDGCEFIERDESSRNYGESENDISDDIRRDIVIQHGCPIGR